jgi:azurin
MKKGFTITRIVHHSVCAFALVCGLLAGCSQAPQGPPKEVQIKADDHMKFDVTAFEAKPGQKISVTLTNVGTSPKASMGHNFVMLDRNANIQSFLDSASMAVADDFVPKNSKGVLAHTRLLGPGETETIAFNAPYVPGDYPYLCSFPGHYSQGTKGIMTVKQ